MTTALATPAARRGLPWPADWSRVARARLGVRLAYRYEYAAPVSDLRQRLVVLPPASYGDQRLLDHDVAVRGADGVAVRVESDRFGNVVHRAAVDAVRDVVEFETTFTVERAAGGPPVRLPPAADLAPYLAPTALTAPNDDIARAAERVAAEADAEAPDDAARRQWVAALGAGDWAAQAISYRHGVTGVHTPAAMALHLGYGVCQDFAHLALAALRALGVPARYVSGHLLGEGAPHAWVEALLPDPDRPGALRAVAYDPTHRTRAGLNYVTVAVGRDYADVAPTSGSYTGTVPGALLPEKDAWIVELAEAER